MTEKIRYRIKGKIYYKTGEDPMESLDLTLVDGIWHMSNPKGEVFKLLIGRGGKRYTMYSFDGTNVILKTNSISKVTK